MKVGQRLPLAQLAELRGDEVMAHSTETLFAVRHAIILGIPGAFTPVCTEKHIPDFVEAADSLRGAGYSIIACVTPNDPWVNARMARELDPDGKLRFLSDGNLDFARACGLECQEREMFMGERSRRYVMSLHNAVVERLKIEPTVRAVSCTRVRDVVDL